MCLILIAHGCHPDYPLIVAANRDEFFGRPTRFARFWEDTPGLLAGRDLEQGGSWLGIDRGGRFAAVTNYREPALPVKGVRSRGLLVSDYLQGDTSARDYLARLHEQRGQYDGFNLFLRDAGQLSFFNSYAERPRSLGPGIYGLSNGELDAPWPKVVRGKERLAGILKEAVPEEEALFSLLADRTPPEEAQLPDTGIGVEWERILGAIFVHRGDYGTRCSTLVIHGSDGRVTFAERSYDAGGATLGTQRFEFSIAL